MLSLHTNAAALSAQNSIGRTQSQLSTSQTRLSTGFRVNSAMDDAAGLRAAVEDEFHPFDLHMVLIGAKLNVGFRQQRVESGVDRQQLQIDLEQVGRAHV